MFSHILFIHSSIDRYLVCFHLSAIVSNAAVNVSVQRSLRDTVFSSFEYIPTTGLPDHAMILF